MAPIEKVLTTGPKPVMDGAKGPGKTWSASISSPSSKKCAKAGCSTRAKRWARFRRRLALASERTVLATCEPTRSSPTLTKTQLARAIPADSSVSSRTQSPVTRHSLRAGTAASPGAPGSRSTRTTSWSRANIWAKRVPVSPAPQMTTWPWRR